MSRTEYELAIKIIGRLDPSLGVAANMTKRQLAKFARDVQKDMTPAGVSFGEAMTKAGPAIDKAWTGMTKVIKTGTVALMAAGTAAVAAGKQALDTGKEFEKAMDSWAATAGASDAEYAKAREAAMEWGRKTTKTATESANALEYMALAGWSVNDSVKSLPSVLKLAEATNLDLARTSDLVTDSMAATQTKIEEMPRFLDVAARANNSSNQTAEQLMVAWLKTGGALANLNVDIEESATALGVMANRGLKAEAAGTALNRILVNMTTGRGMAGKMMNELGISAFDAEGKFIGLKNALVLLNDATKDMTEEDRNRALSAIAGQRQIAGLNDLMQGLNNVLADGSTEWDNLYGKLMDCNGALEQMAATKMDNLWGDIKILQSAWDDTKIRIYDGVTDPLRDAAQQATQLMYKAGGFADTIEDRYPTVRRYFKEGAESARGFVEPLMKAGEFFISNPHVFTPLLGLATTITALKGIKEGYGAINGLKSIFTTGNAAMTAVGWASVIAGGMVALNTGIDLYEKKMARIASQNHFGKLNLTMRELKQNTRLIVGEDQVKRFERFSGQFEKLNSEMDAFQKSSSSFDDIMWKLSAGFELTGEDAASLENSVNSLIEQSISLAEQKKYTVNAAVEVLFGEGDETGNGLVGGFNAMYDHINGDIRNAGEALGKAYKEAMEDSIISPIEAETIEKLKNNLTDLTNQVTQAETTAEGQMLQNGFSGADMTPEAFSNQVGLVKEWTEGAKVDLEASTKEALTANELQRSRTESGKLGVGEQPLSNEEAARRAEQILSSSKIKEVELTLPNVSFASEGLTKAYGDLVDEVTANLPSVFEQLSSKGMAGANLQTDMGDFIMKSLGISEIGSGEKNDIKQKLETLKPDIEELRGLSEELAGTDLGAQIDAILQQVDMLEAITGDLDAAYRVVADAAAGSEEFSAALQTVEERGQEFPQNFADALTNSQDKISAGAKTFAGQARSSVDTETRSAMSSPISVDVKLDLLPSITAESYGRIRNSVQGAAGGQKLPTNVVNHNAAGDRISSPELSWIAEGGDTEYVIPINRKSRSAALWEAAGRELSAAGANISNSSSNKIIYSPVFQVSGGGAETEAAVRRAADDSLQKFNQMMQQYEKDKKRVSM